MVPTFFTSARTKYGVDLRVAASSRQSRNSEAGTFSSLSTATFTTPTRCWSGCHETVAALPRVSAVPWSVSATPWTVPPPAGAHRQMGYFSGFGSVTGPVQVIASKSSVGRKLIATSLPWFGAK